MWLQHKESVWQVQNTLTSNNSRHVGETHHTVAKLTSVKAASGRSFGEGTLTFTCTLTGSINRIQINGLQSSVIYIA